MASTLLLVPTQFECECLSKTFFDQIKRADISIERCGFGPVVSAIRTTQLIARYSPSRVWLAGIAGALDARLQIGSAVEFDQVVCYGIGAGSGEGFVSADEMGWKHWPEFPEISSVVPLNASSDRILTRGALLTCCAAAATEQEVQLRVNKYPNAIAEDMEGFSVAAACRFADVPIRIVRGISNLAGDRNKANWRAHDAMAAVEKWILEELTL
jgi:futalosine hydrolase